MSSPRLTHVAVKALLISSLCYLVASLSSGTSNSPKILNSPKNTTPQRRSSSFSDLQVSVGEIEAKESHKNDYELLKSSSGESIGTWCSSVNSPVGSPVKWYLNKELTPRWALALMRKNLETISSLTGVSFAYTGEVSVSIDSPAPQGLEVMFVDSFKEPDKRAAGKTLLWTSKDQNGVSRIVGARVIYSLSSRSFLFNAARKNGRSPGKSMWQPLLLHELGHAVGLGHSGSKKTVMYPTLRYNLRSLQPGDIAGLSALKPNTAALCQPNA